MISSMTLKRLMIVLGVLVFLAGIGIMWLWQYAYSPEGRARVIIAQLKGDSDTTLRGWLLQHHLIRPGFSETAQAETPDGPLHFTGPRTVAAIEMAKLGPAASPMVIEALHDTDYGVRIVGFRTCWLLGDPAFTGALTAHLSSADSDMVWYAAWALGKIGDRSAIPALLAAMKNRTDVEARVKIAGALLRMQRNEGLETLMDVLKSSNGILVWGLAADELDAASTRAVVDALIPMLQDASPDMRLRAMHAVWHLRDKRVIPIVKKLSFDSDSMVRGAACASLEHAGVPLPPASQPGNP